MIIVEITGGLGNQLFQYSFGRALSIIHKTKLKLDISGFEKYKIQNYSLQHFNVIQDIASKKEVELFRPASQRFVYRNLMSLKRRIKGVQIIEEPYFHFNETAFKYPDNSYLKGYWQSEKYFKHIEEIIRNELAISTPPDHINKDVSDKIKHLNSISLHVRRGDYVSNPKTNKTHGTCDLDYYDKAIMFVGERIKDPQFFIFSDDPLWVKENLKSQYPCHYIDHNDATKNYEDLRLMSRCKHHIIANSSFSWWGAWLNSNPDKIVVAPNKWFRDQSKNTKDLLPETWIRL